MRTSKYRAWLWGITASLLISCGVESPTSDPEPQTDSAESAPPNAGDPASVPVAIPHVFHTPGSACTAGEAALCCPFAGGCSCQGFQSCVNGAWSSCDGAGRRGQPCP